MKSRTRIRLAAALLTALTITASMAAQDNSTPNHHRHHTYRLIDLGTFGGPASAFNDEGDAITQNGIGVGASLTAVLKSSESNDFPCGGFGGAPNVPHAFQTWNASTIDLGTLGGDDLCSNAQMMNSRGEIVGNSEISALDPIVGFHQLRAVVWRNGHIMGLGAFGGDASVASMVTDSGRIVGFAQNTVSDPYSFYYLLTMGHSEGTQTRAFEWFNGVLSDLGTLGGPDANALVANNRGQVVGLSYSDSIPNPTTGIPTVGAFLWERGRMTNLGTLGGVFSVAAHINHRGQIIGTSNLTGDEIFHPFLWDRGVLTDLGTFGGSTGTPNWITDAGAVVGVADLPGDVLHDGVLWTKGEMIDLGNLGITSNAHAINNHGQIVGGSRTSDGTIHGFIWEKGGPIVDLNDLIPPNSSLTLDFAVAINDRGTIAGLGRPPGCDDTEDGCGRAYLLIPDGNCDDGCEQRLAEHERERAAAAPLARAQYVMSHPKRAFTPTERVRNMMRERLGLPGTHATLRD